MIILIKLMNFNQRVNFTKSNTEFKCYLQTTSPVKITTLTVYSQRVHQCGRRCFVLKHQHGRRYVMWNALLVQVPLYWTFHNELSCHDLGRDLALSSLLPHCAHDIRKGQRSARRQFSFKNVSLQTVVQTLCIHSNSPNLESKVPLCKERSLRVNLGPSSCSPAFLWFLKIYLRRNVQALSSKCLTKQNKLF